MRPGRCEALGVEQRLGQLVELLLPQRFTQAGEERRFFFSHMGAHDLHHPAESGEEAVVVGLGAVEVGEELLELAMFGDAFVGQALTVVQGAAQSGVEDLLLGGRMDGEVADEPLSEIALVLDGTGLRRQLELLEQPLHCAMVGDK